MVSCEPQENRSANMLECRMCIVLSIIYSHMFSKVNRTGQGTVQMQGTDITVHEPQPYKLTYGHSKGYLG